MCFYLVCEDSKPAFQFCSLERLLSTLQMPPPELPLGSDRPPPLRYTAGLGIYVFGVARTISKAIDGKATVM